MSTFASARPTCATWAPLALALSLGVFACDKAPTEPKADDSAVGPNAKDAPSESGASSNPEAKAESKRDTASPTSPPPIATDAKAVVGQAAPDFTLVDTAGKPHKLSDYAGKTVVLEWFNPECPFVNHAHTEGSLVSMATEQTQRGVVWLAVNSGAAGKQGHGVQKNLDGAKKYKMTHPILLDETGAVGRAYAAKKTPHIYLIDGSGVLRYRGAIDNAPFGEVDGGGPVENYLETALASLAAGSTVDTPERPAYGCSVKYGA